MSRVISRVHTSRADLERIQRATGSAFEQVRRSPLHDGQQIDGIVLVANTDFVLEHNLGRPFQGFMVVRRNADFLPFESPTVNNAPNNTLILRAGGAVTVSLWVY